MNKKILILSRRDDRMSYDQKTTISDAVGAIETNNTYTVDEYESLVFHYDGTDLKVLLSDGVTDVADFDVVFLMAWFKTKILEDIALSVSLYAKAKGISIANTEALYTRSRSKLSQYVVAALNDITITPFLFCQDVNGLNAALRQRWASDYPVIMKGVQASRGNDNYLVESFDSAQSILEDNVTEEGPWLVVQGFVPNNGDYRIVVMGGEVTAVIHRVAQTGTHLNNTSKGGTATYSDASILPSHVVEQSIRLATLLRREITGVDMIQHRDTGEFYLLEINNMPQLATGSFVQEKITELDKYLGAL